LINRVRAPGNSLCKNHNTGVICTAHAVRPAHEALQPSHPNGSEDWVAGLRISKTNLSRNLALRDACAHPQRHSISVSAVAIAWTLLCRHERAMSSAHSGGKSTAGYKPQLCN